MDNNTIANNYLQWFSTQYDSLKKKYYAFCKEKLYNWDEDIFSETYLKIYDKILKSGLDDATEKGFDKYTFKSFKQNIKREKQYCRTKDRDLNVDNDTINDLYEDYYNEHNDSSSRKLKKDLWIDFVTLYIMTKVDDNFDSEHSYLFRTKYLCNLTYKQLARITNIKGCRMKVLEVKNWVKENITKNEINKAFQLMYKDIL